MRPPKCADPEILGGIERAVRAGASIVDSAASVGVSTSSWHAWMVRGEAERVRLDAARDRGEDAEPVAMEAPYLAFSDTVKKAESAAKVEALAVVRRAIVGWDETTTRTTTKAVPVVVHDAQGREVVQMVDETVTVTTTGRKFSWAAAMTWLERRYPNEFARLMRQELTGANGGPVAFEDVEALRARAVEVVDEVRRRREQRAQADADDAATHGASGNGNTPH